MVDNAITDDRLAQKQYDYLLKFLLVGDSDVGKQEILSGLDDAVSESLFTGGVVCKTTMILLDGKRVKLQLWDTSGQGRFCTIIRSYSRGAQGVLLVYDITNRWSFNSLNRWLKEVDEHAPGVPKVLIGNRLHLAFKRRISIHEAELYAYKNGMAFFEVSPLCNFNIQESFSALSRMALLRNGMEHLWRTNKVLSLKELCCRAIVTRITVYNIEKLPLPKTVNSYLKSYAMTSTSSQFLRYRQSQRHFKTIFDPRKSRFIFSTPPSSSSSSSSSASATSSSSLKFNLDIYKSCSGGSNFQCTIS